MKKSDTLFRHKANLLYEVCGSIREMVNAITAETNNDTSIDLRVYNEMGVTTGMVGAWVNVEGHEGYWDNISEICRERNGQIIIRTQNYVRDGWDMYDFSVDELIYLHDELEKIYKFVVKK